MFDINAVVYSYKNPRLVEVIQNMYDNTNSHMHITVVDQHHLNRKEKFSHFKNLEYRHEFWDHILSPNQHKALAIFRNEIESTYFLVMSDDVMLSAGWDDAVTEFINGNTKVIVSGTGSGKLFHKDKYFLARADEPSESFSLSNMVDRNFIFGLKDTIYGMNYPQDVKYYGEEEKFSIDLFSMGIRIFSAPSSTYQDLGVRTLENMYVPFSIEHNYNSVIDMINDEANSEWVAFHQIDLSQIRKLFYQKDDVPYNPYDLKMMDLGGERFIARTKAIF
tara:strand:- start:24951 stop:25781 length:831 start_codon:yes stop_codon:yes gene_type:complete